MSETIAVIGAGYVGLPTAACFAALGHSVTCADIVPEKVDLLSAGTVPFMEEGLEDLVREGLAGGRLRFVLGAAAAVGGARHVFLCVPTPSGPDGAADMSFVRAACAEIAPLLAPGTVVVNKSTVPIGSTVTIAGYLGRDDVHVVSNPEFLREGTAVRDFLAPDRIVVGALDHGAARSVADLYAGIDAPVLLTDPASAETIKYGSNAFLAVKLSFVNALASICEATGGDIGDVAHGLGLDPRIGPSFLRAGPGWGGKCLPKDSRALVATAGSVGYSFDLLSGAIAANEQHFDHVVERLAAALGGDVSGRRIAVWGLAFKAGTDDLSDSPAVEVVRRLVARGARIVAHDPAVPAPAVSVGVDVPCVDTPLAAVRAAEALVVLTEWPEFATVDPGAVAEAMAGAVVFDTRNVLPRERWSGTRLRVMTVGRPDLPHPVDIPS